MPPIDRKRIAEMFAEGDRADSPMETGRVLEDLIAFLFTRIPGVTVAARNAMDVSRAQEIDVAFWNDGHLDGLRLFDHILLVECKNWAAPVGHPEVTIFADKLRSRGRKLGILVAVNGITGDPEQLTNAHQQIARSLQAGRELIVLTRAEIEALESTQELVVLLKRKRAQLAVSGTSISRAGDNFSV